MKIITLASAQQHRLDPIATDVPASQGLESQRQRTGGLLVPLR